MKKPAVVKTLAGEGGKRGIRTLGTRKGTTVFETAPFDRSGISPESLGTAKLANYF